MHKIQTQISGWVEITFLEIKITHLLQPWALCTWTSAWIKSSYVNFHVPPLFSTTQPAAVSLSVPSGNVTWEPLRAALWQTPVQTINPCVSSGEWSSHPLHSVCCCVTCTLCHVLVPTSHQIKVYHQLHRCTSQTTIPNFTLRQPSSSTSYTLKTAPVFDFTQEQKNVKSTQ